MLSKEVERGKLILPLGALFPTLNSTQNSTQRFKDVLSNGE